jgi:hypothetical protein
MILNASEQLPICFACAVAIAGNFCNSCLLVCQQATSICQLAIRIAQTNLLNKLWLPDKSLSLLSVQGEIYILLKAFIYNSAMFQRVHFLIAVSRKRITRTRTLRIKNCFPTI